MLFLLAPSAFAQSASSQTRSDMQANPSSSQSQAAAEQIRQDLQSAGFTDVKVVAESFVVQAKSKNGDPVVMTIGPHGMSIFEAMDTNGSGSSSSSGTTGSAGSSQSSGSNSNSANETPGSSPPGSRQQR